MAEVKKRRDGGKALSEREGLNNYVKSFELCVVVLVFPLGLLKSSYVCEKHYQKQLIKISIFSSYLLSLSSPLSVTR